MARFGSLWAEYGEFLPRCPHLASLARDSANSLGSANCKPPFTWPDSSGIFCQIRIFGGASLVKTGFVEAVLGLADHATIIAHMFENVQCL